MWSGDGSVGSGCFGEKVRRGGTDFMCVFTDSCVGVSMHVLH